MSRCPQTKTLSSTSWLVGAPWGGIAYARPVRAGRVARRTDVPREGSARSPMATWAISPARPSRPRLRRAMRASSGGRHRSIDHPYWKWAIGGPGALAKSPKDQDEGPDRLRVSRHVADCAGSSGGIDMFRATATLIDSLRGRHLELPGHARPRRCDRERQHGGLPWRRRRELRQLLRRRHSTQRADALERDELDQRQQRGRSRRWHLGEYHGFQHDDRRGGGRRHCHVQGSDRRIDPPSVDGCGIRKYTRSVLADTDDR